MDARIEQLRVNAIKAQQGMERVERDVRSMDENMATAQAQRREIADNINYRQDVGQLETMKQRISVLIGQIGHYDETHQENAISALKVKLSDALGEVSPSLSPFTFPCRGPL